MLRPTLIVLGVILLLAAVGKSALLLTDPFADLRTGYPVWILVLAVIVELALAIALLTRLSLNLIWLAYVILFAILLAVSVVRWAMGFESCDCFGPLKLPVWATPLLNMVALVVLAVVRPARSRLAEDAQVTGKWLFGLVRKPEHAGFVTGTGLALLTLAALGMAGRKYSWLYGDKPIPDQRILLADLVAGEPTEVTVRIENSSREMVRIVGNSRSCGCIALLDRHQQIEPGKSLELVLSVRPVSSGKWHQRVVFFIDHSHQDRLVVDMVGFVFSTHLGG